MATNTRQEFIGLLDRIADEIDRDYPGLRQTDLARWASRVAARAYGQDARIGRKRADSGRPISNDTFGIAFSPPGEGQHHVPFFAVSVVRDDPTGGNERRKPPLDYGLVEDQVWVYPAEPLGQPPAPTPDPPPPIPPVDWGPIFTSLSEDVRALRAGQETLVARLTAIESASEKQLAMQVQTAETIAGNTFSVLQAIAGISIPTIKPPRYRGKLLGMTIVLMPES